MKAWVESLSLVTLDQSLLTILILLVVLRVTMKAGRLPQNQPPL